MTPIDMLRAMLREQQTWIESASMEQRLGGRPLDERIVLRAHPVEVIGVISEAVARQLLARARGALLAHGIRDDSHPLILEQGSTRWLEIDLRWGPRERAWPPTPAIDLFAVEMRRLRGRTE